MPCGVPALSPARQGTNVLQKFTDIIDSLSDVTGKIAGWAFFAVGLFVTFEVVMRYLFNMPTIWVDEVSRIIQVWATYLAIAYVMKERSHIVIDIAFRKAGNLLRSLVETFALIVIIFFCVMTVWYSWQIWLKSTLAGHTTDSYLAVPLVFIQSSIWIGFGLLGLQALAEMVKIWTGRGPATPLPPQVH